MSLPKYIFIAFFLAGTMSISFAQVARSPFSSFGMGEYYGNGQAHVQGMGVGVSNPQYWFLNYQNPALLVFNELTSFQAGIVGERRSVTDGTNTESNTSGNLSYLMLGVPLKAKKWASSLTLMPYTTVNYRYSHTTPIEGTSDTEVDTEEGSGGINQLSWSHGVALHRYFSIGARANYLFGSVENKFGNVVSLPDQAIVISPAIYQRYYFRDVTFTGAASFHIDSLTRKNFRLNIGAVYDLKGNVNTELQETLVRTVGVDVTSDTLSTVKGSVMFPATFSAGISIGQIEKWTIGLDWRVSDFSEYRNFNQPQSFARKNWRWAVGGEITPDPASLGSFLKRMTYRAGISIEQYAYLAPNLINGNPVKDFGINFGLSLPVSRVSSMDIAARWGKRGNIGLNSIEENYFKIFFGVTFNDRWFIKRRFD